jgi:predicted RNA binding protein YcfA (HicA-like mRNA interferase family)
MSNWPATKAKRVLAALEKLGWNEKRRSGSHRTLSRPGWPDMVFAFHDNEEIGPKMLARLAKATGLKPEEL